MGPIPKGTLISKYSVSGSNYGYEYVLKYYKLVKTSYRDNWGDIKYQTEKKEVGHSVCYETAQVNYNFSYSLSTYEPASETLAELEEKLSTQGFNYWSFQPTFSWGYPCDAVSYYTVNKDSVKTVRTVFFANDRFYLLEVSSPYDAIWFANSVLKSITPFDFKEYTNDIIFNVYAPTVLLIVLALALIFFCLYENDEGVTKNKTAKILKWYYLTMTVFSFVMIATFWSWVFNDFGYIKADEEWEKGMLSFAISVCFGFLMSLYLKGKEKQDFTYDFLIPCWLDKYLISRKVTVAERKLIVALICYPFLFITFFVIPLCFVLFLVLEIRTLFGWVSGGTAGKNTTNEQDKSAFKDYYLILDLPRNASSDDVERAFNKTMARYNSQNIGGKPTLIQEAYRVLGSENRLRPAYDAEYKIYENAQATDDYNFTDKRLERDILAIRKEISGEPEKKPKPATKPINAVVLAIIILAFLIFMLFVPKFYFDHDYYDKYSIWEHITDN